MFNRIKISAILAAICIIFYKYIDILITFVSCMELILLYRKRKVNKNFLIGGLIYASIFLIASQGLLANLTIFGKIKISLLHIAILHATIADTAGFFAGKAFGRHKLAPNISPNKTIEGALGALIACILFGLMINNTLSDKWSFVSSIALGVAAIIGDLLISKAKRLAKLKDSSHILQDHGGIWDRIDSVMLVTILISIMAKVFDLI